MNPLTAIPTSITAGDSLALLLAFASYPASAGWSLVWALNGVTNQSVEFEADGDAFAATVAATDTTTWTAGAYRWLLRATNGATVITLLSGALTVLPDLATAVPGIGYWAELKKAAEGALLTLMQSNAPMQVMVQGRQTMFRSLDDCYRIIALCEQKLAMEVGGGGRGVMSFGTTPSAPSPW